jgi:Protein of unknown function (DUF3638)
MIIFMPRRQGVFLARNYSDFHSIVIRDIQLIPERTKLLTASLKHCEKDDGAVILASEYTLSHFLNGFMLDQFGHDQQLAKTTEAFKPHFADIYDEVDEIMRPHQELIYAKGAPP